MEPMQPVPRIPGMSLLADTGPAAWVERALNGVDSSGGWTVATLVPPVFAAYARVLPPTYDREQRRHRWSEIAAHVSAPLTAGTRFDDLVAGSDRWGRPSDGGLDAEVTAALVDVLSAFTATPDEAFFCVWEGFGDEETEAWRDRPMRVRVPHREYHLLAGPLAAAPLLPTPLDWRCANLWWPADRAWLVATEIDGYLTYMGGSRAAIDAVLAAPALDAVEAEPSTRLDPSYG